MKLIMIVLIIFKDYMMEDYVVYMFETFIELV